MPNRENPSPRSRLRDLCRGVGEILGFAVAALCAVVEVLAGRWPDVKERRRRRRALAEASTTAADEIAPYPIQEG